MTRQVFLSEAVNKSLKKLEKGAIKKCTAKALRLIHLATRRLCTRNRLALGLHSGIQLGASEMGAGHKRYRTEGVLSPKIPLTQSELGVSPLEGLLGGTHDRSLAENPT